LQLAGFNVQANDRAGWLQRRCRQVGVAELGTYRQEHVTAVQVPLHGSGENRRTERLRVPLGDNSLAIHGCYDCHIESFGESSRLRRGSARTAAEDEDSLPTG
jgi:hypothetical protein